jgi:hypothetical protein
MFEKTSRLAEKLATQVSRRRFLGSLGRWAGATALGLAGVLTASGTARAAAGTCCFYAPDSNRNKIDKCKCVPVGTACPPADHGYDFVGSSQVADCSGCSGNCHPLK